MLTCALIVWILQPENWDTITIRKTYLTRQECIVNQKEKTECIKIDKRYDLTKKEWDDDNCSISEHEWKGSKK